MSQYSFKTFIAATHSRDFDKPELDWILWAEKFIRTLPTALFEEHCHTPEPCFLCLLESMLKDYKQYSFDEIQFRKDKGYKDNKGD